MRWDVGSDYESEKAELKKMAASIPYSSVPDLSPAPDEIVVGRSTVLPSSLPSSEHPEASSEGGPASFTADEWSSNTSGVPAPTLSGASSEPKETSSSELELITFTASGMKVHRRHTNYGTHRRGRVYTRG